jgi:hypothetical protein
VDELASKVAVFTVWAEAVNTCSSEPWREEKFWFEAPGLATDWNHWAGASRPLENETSALMRWRSPME